MKDNKYYELYSIGYGENRQFKLDELQVDKETPKTIKITNSHIYKSVVRKNELLQLTSSYQDYIVFQGIENLDLAKEVLIKHFEQEIQRANNKINTNNRLIRSIRNV